MNEEQFQDELAKTLKKRGFFFAVNEAQVDALEKQLDKVDIPIPEKIFDTKLILSKLKK